MAKPDTDDGWFKLSLELEAALAFAGFSRVARTLLARVFIQIFGKGKRPKLAYLPQKILAETIEQKLTNVTRAVRELVESGVLIGVGDDRYQFVKDYEKWVRCGRQKTGRGEPRLTEKEVADCKRMIAYAESFRIKAPPSLSDPIGSPALIQLDHSTDPIGSPKSQKVIQMDHRTDPNGSPDTIEDRARVQRDLEEELKRERERARPPENFHSHSNRKPSLGQIIDAECAERKKYGPAIIRAALAADAAKKEQR